MRAVGAVGGEGEGVRAAVGGWRGVGVVGVDEVVEGVDVVGVAVVEEVAFSGAVLGVLSVGMLGVWVRLCVLVLVLVVQAWGLDVRVLHGWVLRGNVLHVLVVGVCVLRVSILRVRVLLLRLSLIGLCLGGLSPDKIFLLHVGDVVVVSGIDLAAAAEYCAEDVDAGETLQKEAQGAVLLDCSFYIQ